MWIFLSNAFLSVVEDRNDRRRVMVRARLPGDIERVFPQADVVETRDADYRFRASLPRVDVAAEIATCLLNIDYHNFKNSISGEHRVARSLACHRVWAIMEHTQHLETRHHEND